MPGTQCPESTGGRLAQRPFPEAAQAGQAGPEELPALLFFFGKINPHLCTLLTGTCVNRLPEYRYPLLRMLSKGVIYMLLSTLFFSLMNVCVKSLAHIPAAEVILFRSLVSLVMSYVMLRRAGVPVLGSNHKWLVARGAAGAIALLLFFNTLQNIPLATAATVQYLSPIFTAILGIFVVKERVRPWQWVFFLVSFAGILVINGVEVNVDGFYLWLGVFSSIFSGLAYVIIRKINTQEHPLVIMFYFPLVSIPVVGVYCLFSWVNPVGWDWALLLLVGVLTQLGQYYMTMSYQAEEISKVANLNYIGMIYALVLGYVLFDEQFSLLTYWGMALVLLGVILNIRYKSRQAKLDSAAAASES
ncbi:DMT family transporter [Pontibacter beigongshangensis]|uniref:DMT family transporter n=1 Tax=Pontibacter beigongshangensis TaxID=2574733 RepID=UPI00293BAE68|nr:DMT family transporter [Pontibacter beigongshangensis]